MKLNELVYSVSSRIAKKAGLQYSTEDPKELQSFIEDLIPALSPELSDSIKIVQSKDAMYT